MDAEVYIYDILDNAKKKVMEELQSATKPEELTAAIDKLNKLAAAQKTLDTLELQTRQEDAKKDAEADERAYRRLWDADERAYRRSLDERDWQHKLDLEAQERLDREAKAKAELLLAQAKARDESKRAWAKNAIDLLKLIGVGGLLYYGFNKDRHDSIVSKSERDALDVGKKLMLT